MNNHQYHFTVTRTGSRGEGTKTYKAYECDHTIEVSGKPVIPGTSEVSNLGNQKRYNPEELLVASLSACHMLWYLHLFAMNKIVVAAYEDKATGTMQNTPDGGGHFTEVMLHPAITIAGKADEYILQQLQQQANKLCFIAHSCNFAVRLNAVYHFV